MKKHMMGFNRFRSFNPAMISQMKRRPFHVRDEWSTPVLLVRFIEKHVVGQRFTLDVCATAMNTKCSKYYTKAENGLTQPWVNHVVFCNPPYSNAIPWLRKCLQVSHYKNTMCVALVRGDASSKWFQAYSKQASRVALLSPRVNFIPPNGVKSSSNSGGSAVFVFDGSTKTHPTIRLVRWK